MAEKLMKYYQYIAKEEGLMGKLTLAKLTKIPSTKASFVEDSPENLGIFKSAVQEITKKAAPNF